jgi:hypothetical protein
MQKLPPKFHVLTKIPESKHFIRSLEFYVKIMEFLN